MTDRKLIVKLCRTYKGGPLATVDGLPGGGADLTPDQLRALAATLLRVAADVEARPLLHRGKPVPDVRREYPVTA